MESKCICSFSYNNNKYQITISVNSDQPEGLRITKEAAINFSMELLDIDKMHKAELSKIIVEPVFD